MKQEANFQETSENRKYCCKVTLNCQWLNSSQIDELGRWCPQVGGAGQCSSTRRRYPWQPYERPPPGTVTLNNSVEYLPTHYLPSPYLKREGGMGKNQGTNWHTNSKLLQQHFAKNCKQATAYISHEVPLLEASDHPWYSWGNCWPALLQG